MGNRLDMNVVIVGGCGHIGLPLGMAFASQGLKATLYDIDANAVAIVKARALGDEETLSGYFSWP